MLVFGHRGAAGLAHENSMAAMRAGFQAGADVLELDVRLTKDGVPVLAHDYHTLRTHRSVSIISHYTLTQLRARASTDYPIVTLEEMLDEFFGLVMINIELKSGKSGAVVAKLLAKKYISTPRDWHYVLLSSFNQKALATIRNTSPHAQLALLQRIHPFRFIAVHAQLRLVAVGFHQRNVPARAIRIAKKHSLFTYTYTINSPQRVQQLAQKEVGGIVTNRPDLILLSLYKNAARSTMS